MRFHLDEHVDHAIARGLRRRGIDVTTTVDAGVLGESDEDQLADAFKNNRVLFTNDADFLRIHRGESEHAGIVFCFRQSHTIGQIVRDLTLIHDCLADSDIHGRIGFL